MHVCMYVCNVCMFLYFFGFSVFLQPSADKYMNSRGDKYMKGGGDKYMKRGGAGL